jgi:hypothetical protein
MIGKKINQLPTELAPVTTDLTIIGDPVTGVSKKITLSQIANLFATSGTVTSVAVTETGDALTITGSPITTSGTINIAFAGTSSQYVNGAGNLITFPTSLISGSGVSGQVTFFNGTNSVTGNNNFFWDTANNRLGIGLTNPQRSIEIFNSTADNHLRLSGNAPSVSMGEAVTGSIYQAKFGLITANGQFVTAGVAGDFIMLSQTGATIFATNSTEKMRVQASGNMCVGNTNDTFKLDVTGTARFTGQLRLESTITDGTNTYTLPSATGTLALTSALSGYLPLTGGTLTGAIQINTNVAGLVLNRGAVTNYNGISYLTNGVGQWFVGMRENLSSNNYIIYNESGTDALTISKSTNAATFSSSVTANKLDIKGGSTITSLTDWNSLANTSFTLANPAVKLGIGYDAADIPLIQGFDTTNAARNISLQAYGGNVGIGTTSPGYAASNRKVVAINGGNAGGQGSILAFMQGGVNKGYVFSIQNDMELWCESGTLTLGNNAAAPVILKPNNTEAMRITSGGNVLIGATSTFGAGRMEITFSGATQTAFDLKTTTVDGNNIRFFNSSNSIVGRIYSDATGTLYVTSSDYRLKQDYKDYSGLDLINKIKTYDYEWKADKSRAYGVIAHELQSVINYAVTGVKDGKEMQGVDYSKIVPILIKAIQEQQTQIEQLKNK